MTFVKVKLALSKVGPGGRLEVTLKEGEPLENVPRSAEEQGHKVLERADLGGGTWRLVIEKGA